MQLHNNPLELRSFARNLEGFTSLIEDVRENILRDLDRLGDTWQDEQFQRFCDSFGRVYRLLEQFIPEAKQVVPKLREDAGTIEEFQRSERTH
jgi:hypothetical protein